MASTLDSRQLVYLYAQWGYFGGNPSILCQLPMARVDVIQSEVELTDSLVTVFRTNRKCLIAICKIWWSIMKLSDILLLIKCDFFHIKECIPFHVIALIFADFVCMKLYESRANLLRGTIRMSSYNNIDVMITVVAVPARGKPGLYYPMMTPWDV